MPEIYTVIAVHNQRGGLDIHNTQYELRVMLFTRLVVYPLLQVTTPTPVPSHPRFLVSKSVTIFAVIFAPKYPVHME